MEENSYPITGKCQCGQVSYKLHKAPARVVACHCQECQTLSTGPYSITAVIEADSIEFRGEMKEWRRIADSGNENVARFCPNCGNRIYHYNPAKPGVIRLKLKASRDLPDHSIFEPSAHVWVSEKQDWFKISDDEKTFCQSSV